MPPLTCLTPAGERTTRPRSGPSDQRDSGSESATRVPTAPNPFTGQPFASDPAVAFVDIISENRLLRNGYEDGLDRLPVKCASQLQGRWNDSLAARDTNDASLLAARKAVDQPLGPTLFKTGASNTSLSSWNGEQHEPAKATPTWALDFTRCQPSARIQLGLSSTRANIACAENAGYGILASGLGATRASPRH